MAQTIEQSIEEVEKELPEELHDILKEREGAAIFAQKLPEVFPPASVSDEELPTAKKWNRIAGFYLQQKRFHEALVIYAALYDQMLAFQEETGSRCHKGLPLIRMSDCYSLLNYGLISARYLMLTLVEDAIRERGGLRPKGREPTSVLSGLVACPTRSSAATRDALFKSINPMRGRHFTPNGYCNNWIPSGSAKRQAFRRRGCSLRIGGILITSSAYSVIALARISKSSLTTLSHVCRVAGPPDGSVAHPQNMTSFARWTASNSTSARSLVATSSVSVKTERRLPTSRQWRSFAEFWTQ